MRAGQPFDPYEVLGVEQDDDFDTIKSRYRELARQKHPDKNGGTPEAEEEFARIAYAYRVLKDPGSRQLYDTTGQTERKPINKEVESVILSAFQDALNKDKEDILDHARRFVKHGEGKLRQQEIEMVQKQIKYTLRRDRVKLKNPKKEVKNLFQILVDKELSIISQTLEQIAYKLEVGRAAHIVLDMYETDEPHAPAPFSHRLYFDPASINMERLIGEVGRSARRKYLTKGEEEDDT